jgi:hypothetical protein
MQILRTDEHVGVEEISHQTPTPRLCPTSQNVAIFLNPRSRNASVKEQVPSSVLATRERAKGLVARAPSVREKSPPLPAGFRASHRWLAPGAGLHIALPVEPRTSAANYAGAFARPRPFECTGQSPAILFDARFLPPVACRFTCASASSSPVGPCRRCEGWLVGCNPI